MGKISLEIDGKKISVPEGTKLLYACRKAGAEVPSLCDNYELSSAGVCRICMVEIERKGWKKLVASCSYIVEDGLKVVTKTPEIENIRKTIVQLLMPHASTGPLNELAVKYGIDDTPFRAPQTKCFYCGLCTRYCNEVKKANVVYFKGRGTKREISLLSGGALECLKCRECWELCPAGWIVVTAESAEV